MKRCWALRPFRAWYLYRVLVSQGVALGYRIKPRWGRRPAAPLGRWDGSIVATRCQAVVVARKISTVWRRVATVVVARKISTVWRRVATVGGGEEDVHRLATRGYVGGGALSPVGAEDRRPVGAKDRTHLRVWM